jgi:hypothetical protein
MVAQQLLHAWPQVAHEVDVTPTGSLAVMKARQATTGPSQTGHTKLPTSRPQQACDVCHSSTIVDWPDMSVIYSAKR